jgi:hypothetical protein
VIWTAGIAGLLSAGFVYLVVLFLGLLDHSLGALALLGFFPVLFPGAVIIAFFYFWCVTLPLQHFCTSGGRLAVCRFVVLSFMAGSAPLVLIFVYHFFYPADPLAEPFSLLGLAIVSGVCALFGIAGAIQSLVATARRDASGRHA